MVNFKQAIHILNVNPGGPYKMSLHLVYPRGISVILDLRQIEERLSKTENYGKF